MSVLSAWCNEFANWAPSLRVVKLHSVDKNERKRRARALITDIGSYDVVVTTYEMLKVRSNERPCFWLRLCSIFDVTSSG